MASGIDPVPSNTPLTLFEAGMEVISGVHYTFEGRGEGKTIADSTTESAESTLPSAPEAGGCDESQGRVLCERSSTMQGGTAGLDVTKAPNLKFLACEYLCLKGLY